MSNIKDQLTVDKIMGAIDNPLFFGWKELKEIVAKNKLHNFLVSERSVGKTTAISSYCLSDYIANSFRFLYIRRTDKVLWKTQKKFFDKAILLINRANLGLKIVRFRIEAGVYYMTINYDDGIYPDPEKQPEEYEKDVKAREEIVGYALSIKAYEDAKSAGFDGENIRHFIYDEFIAEQVTDYLGTKDNDCVEWDDMISIALSLDRDIDNPFLNLIDIWYLGNKAHDYNPILLSAGVNIYIAQSPEAHMICPKDEEFCYVNIIPRTDFKERQKQSRIYKSLKHDKRLQDYNFENKTKDGDVIDEAIKKDIPKGCTYYYGVILNNHKYGIYYRQIDGCVYVGKWMNSGRTEALDLASYANGNVTLLVKQWRNSPILNLIYERFRVKKCYFNNKETERSFLQYLDFVPSR